LRPSLPKKKNPIIKTSIVFICPSTWKDTAVNLPMQINWLRLVPTAIVHDKSMNICQIQHKLLSENQWCNTNHPDTSKGKIDIDIAHQIIQYNIHIHVNLKRRELIFIEIKYLRSIWFNLIALYSLC
jgi:hypothetical protein